MDVVFARPYDELPLKNDKYSALCTELHLGGKGITHLKDFEKFANLYSLFLNNNRLTNIQGLEDNFRIKQLYLHNNRIRTLEDGCFLQFVFLNTLTLNGNCLDDLENTIAQIKPLGHLKSVDLFDNPIAQEDNYRKRVICELSPSCKVLDRHEITPEERKEAKKFKAKMAKLAKMANRGKVVLKLPPSEEEEEAQRRKEEKMQSILKKISMWVASTRPNLETYWAVYDKRNLGNVTKPQFWEILRMFGIEQLLDSSERVMLEEKYFGPVEVPSLSSTGTLRHELINYHRFCWDVLPSQLQVQPPSWRMEVAPEISVTASDLKTYVRTVTLRTRQLEESQRQELLEKSRMLAADSSGASFGERARIESVCLTRHGLEPWMSAELSKIISEFEGEGGAEVRLTSDQVNVIFRKMMRLKLVPEQGIKKSLLRLFPPTGQVDEEGNAVAAAPVSSVMLRAIMGCSVLSPKSFAPIVAAPPADAAPAGKGAKAAPKAPPKAAAPAASTTNSRPAAPVPDWLMRWRWLREEEVDKLGGTVCSSAGELLEQLLRKGAKEDSTSLFRETLSASVDVARITAHQTFRGKKPPRDGFAPPQEVVEKAKNRADIFVLPSLGHLKPTTAPGTASKKYTGLTLKETSTRAVVPKGWASTTGTIEIS